MSPVLRPVPAACCWWRSASSPSWPWLRSSSGPTRPTRYFAWTIQPPLTAAFLGAAYLAGCTLVLMSLRAVPWAHARAAVVTILVFTVLTLVATLAHLDRFHLRRPALAARAAAWFWLAVYVSVPVVLVVLLVLQQRAQGVHPHRARRCRDGWRSRSPSRAP